MGKKSARGTELAVVETRLVGYDAMRRNLLATVRAERNALDEARSIPEVLKRRNSIKVFHHAAKVAKDVEAQNELTALRLYAEWRAGEMLAEMERVKPQDRLKRGSVVARADHGKPTLLDLGITKSDSSNWQKLAAIPKQNFEEMINSFKMHEVELTTSAVLRLSRGSQSDIARALGLGRRHYSVPDREYVNTERTTPLLLFAALDKYFHFTLDAAANEYNTKCEKFLTDAMNQPWDGRVFVHPPFSRRNLPQFIARAREQSTSKNCELIVMLLPADTSTKYFPWDAEAICWLGFRLAYGSGAGAGIAPAPFPSVLVVFAKNGLTERQVRCLGVIGHGWVNKFGRIQLFGERLFISRVPNIDPQPVSRPRSTR